MVIDRHRKAQSLVGYSDVDAINQAIVDGLLATDDPVKHVTYLQTVRRECNQIARQAIIGDTPGDTLKGTRKNVDALIATYGSSLGTLKNAPAPAKYRPLKGVVNRYVASKLAASRAIRSTAFGKHAVDPIKVDEINHRNDKLESRTALELAAVGINSCT